MSDNIPVLGKYTLKYLNVKSHDECNFHIIERRKSYMPYFLAKKHFTLILYMACSNPEISHFPKDPWLPVMGKFIGDKDEAVRSALCNWCVFASKFFQWLVVGNINMHIHRYIYMHICIDVHFFLLSWLCQETCGILLP